MIKIHQQATNLSLSSKTASQFLYLSTVGWKSGRKHRIEIWFVEHDGRYYVLSETGKNAHWIQNMMHNPSVSFSVQDRNYEGRARIVDPKGEVAVRVAALMKEKYGWNEGLIVELAAETGK